VAGVFVRLKVRLLVGSLRSSAGRRVGFVLSCLAAGVIAVVGFGSMAGLRTATDHTVTEVAVIGVTALVLAWTATAVLVFGVDETLDPSRLAPLPLTRRDLTVGLFAASLTGVWPAAILVVLVGLVVGGTSGPVGVVVGVVAIAEVLALGVLLARAVTTSLATALRSRRGRDAVLAIALLLPALPQAARLAFDRNGRSTVTQETVDRILAVTRWTPPGMAGQALASGDPMWLVVPALVAALLARWWVAALGHQLTTVDASTEGAAVRRRRWDPSGPVGGVVVKELAYLRREPRRTIAVLSPVVVTVILSISWSRQGVSPVVPVAAGAAFLGLQTINLFGLDGRALWLNVLVWDSPDRIRADLAGRHLAYSIVAAPALAAMALLSGILADRPGEIVPALLGGLTVLGICLGGGSLNSVLLPMTVPNRANPFGGGPTGQGCLGSLGSVALLTVAVVLALPILIPAATSGPLVLTLLGPVYGATMCWLGRLTAANIAFTRLPELHTAVTLDV